MIGILLSLKGGVMNPIRNSEAFWFKGSAENATDGEDGVRRLDRSRFARTLIETSKGRSLDDYSQTLVRVQGYVVPKQHTRV